ncbi:MAG: nucleotidyltransferase domain-containing protein, partial [Methylococcaceae bacterium]|nr:nucleotidyltransferase domain-containing protein [Methylococcaceae bacterium]
RRDVLGLLLLHPGESYHVREIARMTGRQANTLYRELATLAKAGLLLRRALVPIAGRIELAFVYGSVASGKEGPGSDVDLMLVGELKFEDAIHALTRAEKTLRREINPHVYGAKEFRAKLSGEEPFLRRVRDGPKILLIGDLHDFEESGGHRAAEAA